MRVLKLAVPGGRALSDLQNACGAAQACGFYLNFAW